MKKNTRSQSARLIQQWRRRAEAAEAVADCFGFLLAEWSGFLGALYDTGHIDEDTFPPEIGAMLRAIAEWNPSEGHAPFDAVIKANGWTSGALVEAANEVAA